MQSLTYKILKQHLVKGKLEAGSPIEIKLDQTLTQDATGTMAYMQFEAMGVKQVKTELSVSYVDHNTLQNGFMNADDHAYLQSVASKYGIYFSKAGNGICHQVHLERFAKPGKTLIGSDSHILSYRMYCTWCRGIRCSQSYGRYSLSTYLSSSHRSSINWYFTSWCF